LADYEQPEQIRRIRRDYHHIQISFHHLPYSKTKGRYGQAWLLLKKILVHKRDWTIDNRRIYIIIGADGEGSI